MCSWFRHLFPTFRSTTSPSNLSVRSPILTLLGLEMSNLNRTYSFEISGDGEPGQLSRYSDSLLSRRSGIQSQQVQDSPHPSRPALLPTQSLINWAPGFFPGIKWPGCGVDRPTPSSTEVKERVELYLYSHPGPSWFVPRSLLPFLRRETLKRNSVPVRAGESQVTLHSSTHPTLTPCSLTTHLIFISVINQLDAQNFCFPISLFHASTCFEHMCSSSGGQNCITQPLVSSHLNTPIGVMISEDV